MNIGKLNRRAILQRASDIINDSGVAVRTWSFVSYRWVSVSPRDVESQPSDKNIVHVVKMRHYPGLNSRYRLLVPGQATTLAAAITTTAQTTITLAAALGENASDIGTGAVPRNFHLRVDDELLWVTGGHGTTSLTVERGFEGTDEATHALGVPVLAMRVLNIASPTNPNDAREETELLCTEVT